MNERRASAAATRRRTSDCGSRGQAAQVASSATASETPKAFHQLGLSALVIARIRLVALVWLSRSMGRTNVSANECCPGWGTISSMPATIILIIHISIILFNLFGVVAIPLGALRRWRFVREPIWRYLHLLSLAIVAIQAALGRACFLTIWEDALSSGSQHQPLIARTIDALIYWPIPIWVFAAGYIAIFAYTLALLWLVPPRPIGTMR